MHDAYAVMLMQITDALLSGRSTCRIFCTGASFAVKSNTMLLTCHRPFNLSFEISADCHAKHVYASVKEIYTPRV